MRPVRLVQLLGVGALTVLSLSRASLSLPADTKPFLPMDGLGQYLDYRQALVHEGWRPVAQPGGEQTTPEASCGNAFCTALWQSPSGETATLILWDSYVGDERVLLMAPSPYEINALPPAAPSEDQDTH